MKRIGKSMDIWQIKMPLLSFYRKVQAQNLEIRDVQFEEGWITFGTSPFNKREILRIFPKAELLQRKGIIGHIFIQLTDVKKIILLIFASGVWFFLSQCVFEVEYYGDKDLLKRKIEETLIENVHQIPFSKHELSIEEAEKILKEKYQDELSWLEVVEVGSKYQVYFVAKEVVETPQLKSDPLIATKDGMVVYFDVENGQKMVNVNQIVYKGDVLVNNILVDSSGNEKTLYVKGKVYGYTWYTIESMINESECKNIHDALVYLRLLFDCRNQISKEISDGERIESEKVLQFIHEEGKIKIKIHYTLYEDLTRP